MKSKVWSLRSLWRVFGVCLLSLPMLAACSKSLPVSIHGVNYTVDPFSYVVIDPNNAKNTGGGELIDSFAAGGTTCCYELPRNWRSGIRMSVRSTHWLGKAADNSLHEVFGNHTVEVPRYADGKPGELWVLRLVDGSIDVVSSDFQPDHPKWPGKVKGWPVPSLAYQRQRWDISIDHQMAFLKAYEGLLSQLDSSPDDAFEEAWNTLSKNDKKSLSGFSGPHDEKYREKMKKEWQKGLEEVRAEVKQLRAGRP